MKIIVAPDSFKGTLTAKQAAETMKNAIENIDHEVEVVMKPMADGGEGTLDALMTSTGGRLVSISCTGPLGETINTYYAITDSNIAIIEVALIAGLVQVPENKRNPDKTTSYGIGEIIIDALNKGCASFIIGLGGSATNDGGLGMLQALGIKAFDRLGHEVGPFGENVHEVKSVCLDRLDERLGKVNIQVATDVDNPLCGDDGASVVYGPQKGATKAQIAKFDMSLDFFSQLIEDEFGESFKNKKGSGAAGGLGFAFLIMGGQLVSGAQLLAQTMNLKEAIKSASLVITGEGKSDYQTLFGKAPGYVGNIARKFDVPVILLSGIVQDEDKLLEVFTKCFSIVNEEVKVKESMQRAEKLLYEQMQQIYQLNKNMK